MPRLGALGWWPRLNLIRIALLHTALHIHNYVPGSPGLLGGVLSPSPHLWAGTIDS